MVFLSVYCSILLNCQHCLISPVCITFPLFSSENILYCVLLSPAAHAPLLFCTGERGAEWVEACRPAVEKKQLSRLHSSPLSIIYSMQPYCPLFQIQWVSWLHREALVCRTISIPKTPLKVLWKGWALTLQHWKDASGVFPLLRSFIHPPLIDPSLPTNFVYYTHYLLLNNFSSLPFLSAFQFTVWRDGQGKRKTERQQWGEKKKMKKLLERVSNWE